MARIKLKTDNKCEKIILNYLEKNASDDLVERINNGKKTLTQCWNYITSEAKKEAKNGCACIEDATVYGWAVHFFEEDSISGEAFNKSTPVKTAASAEASASEELNDVYQRGCVNANGFLEDYDGCAVERLQARLANLGIEYETKIGGEE